MGETGAIKVTSDFCTSDPHIYAVGDAIEVYNSLTRKPAKLPLAGPALRQARTAADAIYGKPGNGRGVIGSCAVRVFGLNAAATGLNEKTAKQNGISCDSVYTMAMDKVGIMPGSAPIHFKLVFEVPTGRILGAQAIGKGNVDKRIDVIATLIAMNGTLEDLKELELCYSPVFGTARDVVNLAALVALNILHGVFRQVHVDQVRELVESGACIIDVRTPGEFQAGHLNNAVNIPRGQLRQRLEEAAGIYGLRRLALDLQRLRMSFPLPCPTGEGEPLSRETLAEMIEKKQQSVFYSHDLCAKYFTITDAEESRFVLFDDADTIRRKLRIGQELGITAGFLMYPEVYDLLPELLGQRR